MTFPKNVERPGRVADLHAQGLNDVRIAEQLGCTVKTIRMTRRDLGLPPQPRPEPKPKPMPLKDVDRFLAACRAAEVVCPRPKNTTNTRPAL